MEKSFQLDQREATLIGQLDLERTQALAMVGALSLDMEQARKNLDSAAERQKVFIRAALSARNVERYDNARVQNGALIVALPDTVPLAAPPPSDLKLVEKVNGSPMEAKE